MYLFIVRFSLILEIFLDHFLISILSYGVHIVTACPKFSAPKQPFYLGMKPKNLFCRNTFNSTDYLFGGIRWYTLNQKMDVVSIKSNLQKMNFISLFYLQADLFKRYRNLIIQYIPPIFDRTNKMIKKQTLVMTFMDMFTHNHKYKYLYATPEAEPRGILLIKSTPPIIC